MQINKKLYGIEIFGSVAFAIVFLALSYIALTEKTLTTGDPKTGIIHTATGNNAVLLGLTFFALGLAALAYLVRYTKYRLIYWLFLSAVWLGGTIWYWHTCP